MRIELQIRTEKKSHTPNLKQKSHILPACNTSSAASQKLNRKRKTE